MSNVTCVCDLLPATSAGVSRVAHLFMHLLYGPCAACFARANCVHVCQRSSFSVPLSVVVVES